MLKSKKILEAYDENKVFINHSNNGKLCFPSKCLCSESKL